ncbi:MAG: hypothetical protein HC880_01545 [Bacteroidia bacterium]|nr:hypothetical protein [Bacteroidia bacterium]
MSGFAGEGCVDEAVSPVVVVLDPSFGLEIDLVDGVLEASINGAEFYQWYYDFLPIAGANTETYTPTLSGSYYLIVRNEECTASSNLFVFEVTGAEDESLSSQINIFLTRPKIRYC